MNYVLDAQAINAVLPAVCKGDGFRPYLTGVHIEDVDDKRIYTATNGHILFQIVTERKSYDEKLDKDYIVIFDKKFDKRVRFVEFEPTSEISGTIDEDIEVKLVNMNYPDVSRVIPKRKTPIARDYALFDSNYLKKVNKFLNTTGWIPQMENNYSPAVWYDDNKIAVLMPMREAK